MLACSTSPLNACPSSCASDVRSLWCEVPRRGTQIAVAKPALDGDQVGAAGHSKRREGVPQGMERQRPQAGLVARCDVASPQRRAVELAAELAREHEVVIIGIVGSPGGERVGQLRRHRQGPRALPLGRARSSLSTPIDSAMYSELRVKSTRPHLRDSTSPRRSPAKAAVLKISASRSPAFRASASTSSTEKNGGASWADSTGGLQCFVFGGIVDACRALRRVCASRESCVVCS